MTERVTCTSEVSSERYFAVSNATGHIVVYDCKDILKVFLNYPLNVLPFHNYFKDYNNLYSFVSVNVKLRETWNIH
jgi:hypothetical protein